MGAEDRSRLEKKGVHFFDNPQRVLAAVADEAKLGKG
jgi:hypothetical protein